MDVTQSAGQDDADRFRAVFRRGFHIMKLFNRTILVGAAAAALSLTACTPPNGGASARASGSLALSNDDSTVFAVDTDNGQLLRIDPVTKDVKTITVGKSPVRVIVGPDDTVFVTNN